MMLMEMKLGSRNCENLSKMKLVGGRSFWASVLGPNCSPIHWGGNQVSHASHLIPSHMGMPLSLCHGLISAESRSYIALYSRRGKEGGLQESLNGWASALPSTNSKGITGLHE
jgi:hypothetical protein